jgi:hypothetical protein
MSENLYEIKMQIRGAPITSRGRCPNEYDTAAEIVIFLITEKFHYCTYITFLKIFRRVHKIAKSEYQLRPSVRPHGTTRLPLGGFS